MKRRLLAAVLALVLALGGGVVLLRYVTGADRRAMAGMATTSVLVATAAIPAGTPADELAGMVKVRTLPQVAVADSAAHDLTSLAGKVSTADLAPGEQVLTTRFAAPDAVHLPPELPKGTQQVTVLLDPQRAVGGNLAAGDKVGVFLSTDFNNHPLTHLVASEVLVMNVVGGTSTAGTGSNDTAAGDGGSTGGKGGTAAAAGNGGVTVTLAVATPLAERLVFAAEHGTVWLSKQNADTTDTGRSVITEGNLYR